MSNFTGKLSKLTTQLSNPIEYFLPIGEEKIDLKIAQAILDKYNRLKKPFEKEQFQAKISKSKRDMLKALKEDIQIEKKQDSLREVKNLMKENRERYDG